MADTTLDLTLDAAALTARLVDFRSESGTEKPLADAIEAVLRELPHLTVDRYGNNVIARTDLGRAERVVLASTTSTRSRSPTTSPRGWTRTASCGAAAPAT